MLVAEAYGFDTAPMEGFDPDGVKKEFGIPDEAEVVALIAIGRAAGPDKSYPGRFSLDKIVYAERYGEPWQQERQDSPWSRMASARVDSRTSKPQTWYYKERWLKSVASIPIHS